MSELAIDEGVTDASATSPAVPAREKRPQSMVPTTDLIFLPPRRLPEARLVVWTLVEGLHRRFVLTDAFTLQVEEADDGFVVRHRSLPVIGSGRTVPEALKDWSVMFEAQWEGLVDCSADELTPAAQRARELFQRIATPLD